MRVSEGLSAAFFTATAFWCSLLLSCFSNQQTTIWASDEPRSDDKPGPLPNRNQDRIWPHKSFFFSSNDSKNAKNNFTIFFYMVLRLFKKLSILGFSSPLMFLQPWTKLFSLSFTKALQTLQKRTSTLLLSEDTFQSSHSCCFFHDSAALVFTGARAQVDTFVAAVVSFETEDSQHCWSAGLSPCLVLFTNFHMPAPVEGPVPHM